MIRLITDVLNLKESRMSRKPPEIDYRTMKLMVGLIAIYLSGLTIAFSDGALSSISHAYCGGGTARDIFVGSLFAIAAMMVAHNGLSRAEFFASKGASAAAVAIAVFPTACGDIAGSPWHFPSAALMFSILAWFCWSFYRRTKLKMHQNEAARRRVAYAVCGIGIVLSMLAIGAKWVFGLWDGTNAVFVFEAIGLALFGVSWLIASHFLPFFDHPTDRQALF